METLFYHGTTIDGSRFTIAGDFIDSIGRLFLGAALCSPNDQFIKKVGRNKSEGRLNSNNSRGFLQVDLYSSHFFDFEGKEIKQHWFKEMKSDVFVSFCANLENLDSEDFKVLFNLSNRPDATFEFAS